MVHETTSGANSRASRERRPLAMKTASVLLGSLLAVLLLEASLRVTGYAGDHERMQRAFDPRYGSVPKDSWIFSFAIDPQRHHAVDLRGQLVPLRKPADETRVLFIGDSATEGAFVTLEQAYPARLEALLRKRNPKSRVRAINAGVWGMTTLDELQLLQNKLLPLAPDAVVLGLFMANDINFNLSHARRRLHYRAPSWFAFARQHSALAHVSFLQALALNQRYRFARPETLGAQWLPEELSLVDSYGLHMLSYPAGELALYLRRPSALVDEAFEVLHDALAQLAALGQREGFRLRVLLIPTPSAVLGRLAILHHPDILYQLRQQGIAIERDDLDFALPTRRVLALCKRLALDCVDATRELRQLGAGAFFVDDEHPTAAGHEALARALMR